MFSWIGYRQTGVPYAAPPRMFGETKYSRRHMLRLGTHGIMSFSNLPLRFVLSLGIWVSLFAVAYAAYALVMRFVGTDVVHGWSSIVFTVSLLGGIQLIVLGIVGQYVGLVYEEVKQRPLYLVSDLHGFEL
jgi:dolichol-phosphate mannosyltransferase